MRKEERVISPVKFLTVRCPLSVRRRGRRGRRVHPRLIRVETRVRRGRRRRRHRRRGCRRRRRRRY